MTDENTVLGAADAGAAAADGAASDGAAAADAEGKESEAAAAAAAGDAGKAGEGAGDKAGEGDAGKAGDGAAEKPKDGEEADKGKQGAPEKYEPFKLPDGWEKDDKALSEFEPLAKELGLNQEQAQAFVDLAVARDTRTAEAQAQQWTDLRKSWVDEAKADKEIGGAEWNAKVATAIKGLKAFGTPELEQALNVTGVGDHPEFIRLMYRVGKAVTEDGMAFGGHKSDAKKDATDILYPSKN